MPVRRLVEAARQLGALASPEVLDGDAAVAQLGGGDAEHRRGVTWAHAQADRTGRRGPGRVSGPATNVPRPSMWMRSTHASGRTPPRPVATVLHMQAAGSAIQGGGAHSA